jgi:hypothetical protein
VSAAEIVRAELTGEPAPGREEVAAS